MVINQENTSSLPPDIINEILIKFISRSRCRFCEASKVLSIIIAAGLDRTPYGTLSSPFLLHLPPPHPGRLEFICQIDQEVSVKTIPLNLGGNVRCVGSSKCFLVFANASLQLLLLNPVNKNFILLPPLRVDGILREDIMEVKKIVVSQTTSSLYAVAVFKSDLLVLKVDSGDSWKHLDSQEAIIDFTCEGKKLFLLTQRLSVEVWCVETQIRIKQIGIDGFLQELEDGRIWDQNRQGWVGLEEERFYLHRVGDEFKLIGRLYGVGLDPQLEERYESIMKTMDFKVFGVSEQRKWVEEASMDDTIFLGINETFVIQHDEYPVLSNKSIYFLEDFTAVPQKGAGIFSWEDHSLRSIPIPNLGDNSALVWFFPRLFQLED